MRYGSYLLIVYLSKAIKRIASKELAPHERREDRSRRPANISRGPCAPGCRSWCIAARMADVYRETVSGRCQGLARENSRLGATDAIRGLIQAIVLDPETASS